MKIMLKIGSLIGLMLTIVPPVLFFLGQIEIDSMKLWMGIGMLAWMVTAPFWINRQQEDRRPETEEK
ncbi:hypothetical protein CLV31_103101 [Algoriphagus aquaeductus]|uniref:Uncharacterized protein n=1 Tax=Algoriphagus aquaeductus TaxID=475299 RepID=A0A326RVT0_9BACT|nr:hypothetical protein [Algoriphagus aquaeductus]PZV85310.1 hypothetical protein CLV31_103101 [Algoriphagus aquaeductus]